MPVIFDLDQTLVDSSPVQHLRDRREWGAIKRSLHMITPYTGIWEMIESLNGHGVEMAIVSTAPRTYCEDIVRHHGWPIRNIVGYHDAKRKPLPDPMLLAVSRFTTGRPVISIGDRAIDVQASNAAGLTSVGCFWGSAERELLLAAAPHYCFETVDELSAFLVGGAANRAW